MPEDWREREPGDPVTPPPSESIEGRTIVEALARYLDHAEAYYRGSTELPIIMSSVAPLREMYGRTSLAEFGPKRLKAVREELIAAQRTRQGIIARITCFNWAKWNESKVR